MIISNTYNLSVIFSGIITNSGAIFKTTPKKKKNHLIMPNYVSDLFKHTKLALIEINTHLILFFEKCFIIYNKIIEKKRASLVGQTLKNLPTM